MFPDSNVQWRLNWFNDIKMPLLTTLLLFKSDIDIGTNMQKMKKVVQLNSLTSDELYVKNAMKNSTLHQKAIDIIQEAMGKIMQTDKETNGGIREVNIDQFLQRCNHELMNSDPNLAVQLGIKIERKLPTVEESNDAQSPEELAAQEAEREKML